MVIKKGTSRSSSISRIRHRTFVSPSLGSKLALVVSLTIFGFGIMAAGTGMGMPPICVIGGVIIFIALILQIFGFFLAGSWITLKVQVVPMLSGYRQLRSALQRRMKSYCQSMSPVERPRNP